EGVARVGGDTRARRWSGALAFPPTRSGANRLDKQHSCLVTQAAGEVEKGTCALRARPARGHVPGTCPIVCPYLTGDGSGRPTAPSDTLGSMREPLLAVLVAVLASCSGGGASYPDRPGVAAAQAGWCESLAKLNGAGAKWE